jgi:DNA-binding winged helix-turn-helix (wHTH) protein
MDRAMTERHLVQAEDHVRQGARHVAQQSQRIAELKRRGYETTEAQALLAEFEKTLALHIAHRDRLKKVLTAV